MTRVARSLRPNPLEDLLHKEAETLRAANAEPPPHTKITDRLNVCVVEFGLESTHKAVSVWARNNRPQKLSAPARSTPKDRAELAFRKIAGGAE